MQGGKKVEGETHTPTPPSNANKGKYVRMGGINLSDISRSNFKAYFEDITSLVTASGCKANCSVTAISVAKKIEGQAILDAQKFTEDFVGNGEGGLSIIEEYVGKIPTNLEKGIMNGFPNRAGTPLKKYLNSTDNKVFTENILNNAPNNSHFLFAAYKGMNTSNYTGHVFNVFKDGNGVIKYVDVQDKDKLQYGEGISSLIRKMKDTGYEQGTESNSWYIFDGSLLKK